jgi:hypothetical protein
MTIRRKKNVCSVRNTATLRALMLINDSAARPVLNYLIKERLE